MQPLTTLTFGERLHIARRRAGLNTTEMSRRLRVSSNTIRSWEADRTAPKYLEVIAWAEVCGIEADTIDPDIRNRCSDNGESCSCPQSDTYRQLVPTCPVHGHEHNGQDGAA